MIRGIPAALVALMLCLVPVAQAWGSEQQVELLSNVNGHFTENRGQLDDDGIDYYCLGSTLSVAFGTTMVSYDHRPAGSDMGAMFRVSFNGSNGVEPVGVQEMRHHNNYFIGNDPEGWVTGARNFREVLFPDLYDGIDLRFRFEEGRLKYDFIVAPGADPGEIIMGFEGIEDLVIDKVSGDLLISTPVGVLRDQAPLTYGVGTGPVSSEYRSLGSNAVGFSLGPYDETTELVIDPGLEFCTIIGTFEIEGRVATSAYAGGDIRVDGDGNTYLCGRTNSIKFPVTSGAYETNKSGSDLDGIVLKLSSDGSSLEYSTYIGGDGMDECQGLSIDGQGAAFVSGYTSSQDFPTTPGVISRTLGGIQDAFLFKLNSTGSSLELSSYIGGNGADGTGGMHQGFKIHRDGSGDIYLVGETNSTDFPAVSGCYDTTHNGEKDAFVVKVNDDCSKLLLGTYLGGLDMERGISMFVDDGGYVYLSGYTESANFPTTPNAYQTTVDLLEVFVTKLDPSLSKLEYSTLLGGTRQEWADSLVVDDNGCAIVGGTTASSDFPTTPGAYDSTNIIHHFDTFITKLNKNGTGLEFSTFFGHDGGDKGMGVNLDDLGNIYFSLGTTSDDLETTDNAFCSTYPGHWDVFLGRFDPNASSLDYGSYLGGSELDSPSQRISLVGPNVTVMGLTGSWDFPTTEGAFCTTYHKPPSPYVYKDYYIARLFMGPPGGNVSSEPMDFKVVTDDGAVGLQWSEPEVTWDLAIRGYRIYRGDDADDLEIIWTTGSSSNSFTDFNVVNGHTYYYAVSALNFHGEGNLTDVIEATPLGRPSPDLFLSVTPGCSTVRLNWSTPSHSPLDPVIGFRIYKGTDLTPMPLLKELGVTNEYVDEDVVNGDTYFYKIHAFTANFTGHNTSARTVMPVGPPSQPMGFRAHPQDGEVILRWSVPETNGGRPILGYRLLRGESEAYLSLHADGIDNYEVQYNDEDLVNGVTYYYALLAFNDRGDSPPTTNVINATPYGPPSAPVIPVVYEHDGLIIIHWGRPLENGGDPELWYLVACLYPNGSWVDGDFVFNTSHVWTGLENGINYSFRVRAGNKAHESPWSEAVSATPWTLPNAPTSLEVVKGNRFLQLSWTAPDYDGGIPIVEYVIYRGESLEDMKEHDRVEYPSTRFTDMDVEDGKTYIYMITTVTERVEGPASDIIDGLAFGPPGPPQDLVANPGDGQVVLGWTIPSFDGGREVRGYNVYRGDTPETMDPLASTGMALSYTDEQVENGKTYYYAVSAYNSIDEGTWSGIVQAQLELIKEVPGLIRNLRHLVDETSVTLDWQSPMFDGRSPLLEYTIKRGLSRSDMVDYAQVDDDVLSFTDENLTRGKDYFYSVAARNVMGTGAFSPVVQATIEKVDEPIEDESNWLLLIVVLCVCIVTIGAIASTESGRYRWGLLLGPLTTRLKRDEVLDNKTRHALLGIIITQPGIHYQAIKREFDLKNGVAAYHLDVLEREDYIRSVRDGRLKRFYSTDTKIPKDQRSTPEEVREEILEVVSAQPGISQKRIVNELGIDGETVRYHLRVLVENGELQGAKDGRHAIYYRET